MFSYTPQVVLLIDLPIHHPVTASLHDAPCHRQVSLHSPCHLPNSIACSAKELLFLPLRACVPLDRQHLSAKLSNKACNTWSAVPGQGLNGRRKYALMLNATKYQSYKHDRRDATAIGQPASGPQVFQLFDSAPNPFRAKGILQRQAPFDRHVLCLYVRNIYWLLQLSSCR